MAFSTLEKLTLERSLFYIIIAGVFITFLFLFYLFFSRTVSSIELLTPNGGEIWEIGFNYKIRWKAKGISKVGIVLFEGKEPKWIARNITANLGEYEWKIYPGQKYGDDYWIAVFEYPWKRDNKIDFSDAPFAIAFPTLASCEKLSVTNEWPHVPSDMPNLRKVFITDGAFSGKMGGLDGADRLCQSEAVRKGLEGNFMAFLGGDSDDDTAEQRLSRSPGGAEGIFVEADSEATLIRGADCHRLIAKDFDKFLEIFSESSLINEKILSINFFEELNRVWLGRLTEENIKSCVEISDGAAYRDSPEKYSLTVTCQNWTKEDSLIRETSSLPTCYTSAGTLTDASALSGLSSGILNNKFSPELGRYCSDRQKIICVEK